ncbi:MAG TPA: ribosome silencing factor [Cytophagales bacterium]|jgi:ribosome-associated protein|nr:ribosome silencing factor [Cytophagales bacterium]
MTEGKDTLTSEDLSKVIVKGIQEKKGKEIAVLDLRNINNAIADYFIICSGTSDTQVESIARSVEEQVFKIGGEDPWHKEGLNIKEWVLLDYVNVVTHIFKEDTRNFYGLEDLWGDADITRYEEE